MKNLLSALQFFRQDAGRIAWAMLLLLLSSAGSLLKPWPLALIVDSVLGSKPLPTVLQWAAGWDKGLLLSALGGCIVLLYAVQSGFAAGQTYLAIQIGLRGLVRVR